MTKDIQNTTDHPSWCSPTRCSTATLDPAVGPVVLEHVGERIELTSSQGRIALERVAESGPDGLEFVRFTVEPCGAEPCVIHASAGDAQDLAGLLQLLASQIVGRR